MKWLLVFIGMAGADIHVTTERFESKAECFVTAQVLNEWEVAPGIALGAWACARLGDV